MKKHALCVHAHARSNFTVLCVYYNAHTVRTAHCAHCTLHTCSVHSLMCNCANASCASVSSAITASCVLCSLYSLCARTASHAALSAKHTRSVAARSRMLSALLSALHQHIMLCARRACTQRTAHSDATNRDRLDKHDFEGATMKECTVHLSVAHHTHMHHIQPVCRTRDRMPARQAQPSRHCRICCAIIGASEIHARHRADARSNARTVHTKGTAARCAHPSKFQE
jgi:hypothetical protein